MRSIVSRVVLRFASCFVFGVVALAFGSPAQAALWLEKGQLFEQTSHGQPLVPTGYVGILMETNAPSNLVSITINTSSPASPYTLNASTSWTHRQVVSTVEELETLFPNAPAEYLATFLHETSPGSYTYSFGSYFPTHGRSYFGTAPYLTGDSYDHLQGVDPSETFLLQWVYGESGNLSDIYPDGGGVWGVSEVEVRRAVDGTLVEGATIGSWILGGFLDPGTDYILTILSGESAGNFDYFFSQTSIPFTTAAVPEPSSLLLLGLGGVAVIAAARRKLKH